MVNAEAGRPGRMHVEAVTVSQQTGHDFVVPGRTVSELFSARLMDGSSALEVIWTHSLGQGTLANRLAQVQQIAGGPGKITRITGQASAKLQEVIRTGQFNAQQSAQSLGRRLGGTWHIDVIPRANSIPQTWDIIAVRIGG